MSNKKRITKYLKDNLSDYRYNHTMGSVKAAKKLAVKYGVDVEDAELAALLHDCGKEMQRGKMVEIAKLYGFEIDDVYEIQKGLLHGVAGAYIARENFGISDERILNSIIYHTIPRLNMTKLDMVISVADLIEETRTFDNLASIRIAAMVDLEYGFLLSLRAIMQNVLHNKHLLHTNTVIVYNNLLKQLREDGRINVYNNELNKELAKQT